MKYGFFYSAIPFGVLAILFRHHFFTSFLGYDAIVINLFGWKPACGIPATLCTFQGWLAPAVERLWEIFLAIFTGFLILGFSELVHKTRKNEKVEQKAHAQDEQVAKKMLASLGLSIVASVVFLFGASYLLQSMFGVGADIVILAFALLAGTMYAIFSVRSLKSTISGVMLRVVMNILFSVLGGFFFTIATTAFFQANNSLFFFPPFYFLNTHLIVLGSCATFVAANVFIFDYSRRQWNSYPARTPVVKVV